MCHQPKFSATRQNVQFTNQILLLCVMKNTTEDAVNAAKNHFVAIKCIESP